MNGQANGCSYPLSHGTEVGADGTVRFRLWAPDCHHVELVCADDGSAHAMTGQEDGWFALETTAVPPGSAYTFHLDSGLQVPDPASRAQAGDVHGPSLVVDPSAFVWQARAWAGRPWKEAVVSEVHVGTVTPEGTFDALRRRLDHFARTGITAIELMPVAQFSGNRGWGYDGVLLYAPHPAYGTPDDFKRLVDEAHMHGLMVLLDVVYNHFGPDGNYLGSYASRFFRTDDDTPWGSRIAMERTQVRAFFIENALYWLREYCLDGLRLDAVNQIRDDSGEHVLRELARRVRVETESRYVHLLLENDNNEASLLERDAAAVPELYTAQWNDDVHHAMHVVLTGETDGYYADFADDPTARLARGLAEGFIYQGEASPYRDGQIRGEASGSLPCVAFVDFIQNHDQVGNRAFGERLTTLVAPEALDAALCVLLLSPHVPMMFMGDEWGAEEPFLFFCDFHGELAAAVRSGRRREFARFASFTAQHSADEIPDPNERSTFEASRLDWSAVVGGEPGARYDLVCRLLDIRRREIAPRLATGAGPDARIHAAADGVLAISWEMVDGSRLRLDANLSARPRAPSELASGRLLWAFPEADGAGEPWSVHWSIAESAP